MEIKTKLIPKGTLRRSGQLTAPILFITLHDTGNPNSTAMNNVNYYIDSCNYQKASAHIFVDDKEAIMCIPAFEKSEKAWHVMYDPTVDNELYGDDANDCSIGVECCYFPNDVNRTLKAYKNYVEVVVQLLKFHKLSHEKTLSHKALHKQRKVDPDNMLKVVGKIQSQLEADIRKEYEDSVMKDYIEVLKENAINVQEWIDGINAIEEIAKLNCNLGVLEIFKSTRILIEKIGNK